LEQGERKQSAGWTFFQPFDPTKEGLDLSALWKDIDDGQGPTYYKPNRYFSKRGAN
jgi:hypothetical protein